MMLQALYQLAQREGLMADPDYEPKPVAWIVRLDRGGKLLGIEGTHYTPPQEGKKKPKPIPRKFSVPREGGRTSGDRAFLFCDKAEYVFGIDPAGERPKEKLAIRFKMFLDRIEDCVKKTQDDGAKAVCTLLQKVQSGEQAVALPENCAGNDLFAFVCAPDVDQLVTDRSKIRAYWKDIRSEEEDTGNIEVQCLVSGQACVPGELFPSLKKVPGGSTSGVALVSFNKNAFESYGWKSNENATISRDASETCATALNRLLDPSYPDPKCPEQSLPKRHVRLSADTVVCFWAAEASGDEFASTLPWMLDADPEKVNELYRSVWRGKAPDMENPGAFYAITLTGTQGRAIVRDWFETTVSKVVTNLAQHFADLDIVRNTPKPKERELPPQLPLGLILESLSVRGDREGIPAHLAGELVRSAFTGSPYPIALLQRALERTRAEIGSDDWADMARRDARAAIIKAVLNRRKRGMNTYDNYQEVQRTMDPNNKAQGYLLGRLMAVIERMQQIALGDVNASVVDRFFSGASATPSVVFPRLLKNLRHHARKAADNNKKVGWLERLADQIMSGLSGFPPHLDLEQQGLFVLGYHHQRNALWTKKEDREGTETPVEQEQE